MTTPLMTLDNIDLSFGPEMLLDQVKLNLVKGERICLIGRNGAGKSSLLKIIEGSLLANSGNVWRQPELRLSRLCQELPQQSDKTVYAFVAEGLAEAGTLLADYHLVTHEVAHSPTQANLDKLEQLQKKIETIHAWHFEQTINTMLTQLDLDPEKKVASLSGGRQRCAALARALVTSPDVLLLDEPTNHLDIEAIQWIEDYLLSTNLGLIFITHDRALLQRLATRIIELDRGKLTSWPGNYQHFLTQKAALLHAEEKLNANFDKKLAEEEKWIRQGVKARRTRNEGRVSALEAMRLERQQRRQVEGTVTFNINKAATSGQLVIEATHLSHQYNNQVVIQDFSVRVMRGDRIGFIGPNGIGKTTLLNLLLGNLAPQQGTVKLGTKLEIAYFDQLRQEIDFEKTVVENVGGGSDFIEIDGKRQHIIGYLGDFLFTPQRARTPVRVLSGGECNRLLLARMFSRPSNLLVMDEPTNDLDLETLELLEEKLGNYPGTLLLVSHDRQFLDHVVTSTLVFEGEGLVQEYIGGYDDWIRQRKQAPITPAKAILKTQTPPNAKKQTALKALLKNIDTLEAALAEQHQLMAEADFYLQSQEKIDVVLDKQKQLERELKALYQRWEDLEG